MENRREELNISVLQEQLHKPRFTKAQIMAWLSRVKYGDPDDPEYQKQIINTFVNSVYVYDDQLVMPNNYKDGTETISLDAVHQSFGSDLNTWVRSAHSCLNGPWPDSCILDNRVLSEAG